MQSVHIPILCKTIIQFLTENLKREEFELKNNPRKFWILDGTFGGGGHSRALLEELKQKNLLKYVSVLGFDQDSDAIERGKKNFSAEIKNGFLELYNIAISQYAEVTHDRQLIGVLADLGFSSDQIEDAGRGLSFQKEGPLDMRLSRNNPRTAYELLCSSTQKQLEKILMDFGEERFAPSISKKIIEERKKKSLPKSTTGLAKLIEQAVPPFYRFGRIHPATKTFQALRIAVNSELDELDTLLENILQLIETKGRGALLSFHSLEDRKVKTKFKELAQGPFKILTKKPVLPSEEEQKENPRSRSAKLRVIERC